MIDLYAAPTSNGLRAKIMLDECGLDYTLHAMNLAEGAHKAPDYLAINPMGLIPTIVDDDGPGGRPVTLSQSIAILTYLAEKTDSFIPPRGLSDPLFCRDMMSIATDMTGALMAILTIGREKSPHIETMNLFGTRFRDLLGVWDATLVSQPYCAGAEVTIADFAFVTVMIRCKAVAPHYAEGCPGVDRWYEDMTARPGVRKGLDFGLN